MLTNIVFSEASRCHRLYQIDVREMSPNEEAAEAQDCWRGCVAQAKY